MLVSCSECGTESEGYRLAAYPPCNKGANPCAYCGSLREVDKSIDEARRILEGLVRKRTRLLRKFNKHHDPFSSLPTEVISDIFGVFIPTASTIRKFQSSCCFQHGTPPQFVLASVCRDWRDIIWGIPAFWTTLNLRIGDWITSQRTGMVKEWLERSQHIPFSLCLVRGRDGKKEDFQRLADVLNDHLHNCKTLHYLLASPKFGAMLRMHGGSSRMEDLRFHLESFTKGWKIFDAPPTLPLKSLELECYRFWSMNVRWKGLTSLTMELRTEVGWTALGLCYHLQSLVVEFADCFNCSDLTIPYLTRLTLIHPPLHIYPLLKLPKLQWLHIRAPQQSWERLPDVGGLVQHSNCSLQHLNMEYRDEGVPPQWVTSLLQEIPSLTTLEWAAPLSSNFMDHFRATTFWETGSLGSFLPNLTSFTYRSHLLLLPWSAIGTLIPLQPPSPNMSRRPLSKVYFSVDVDPADEMLDFDVDDAAMENARMSKDELSTLTDMISNAGMAEFRVEERHGLDLIKFWTDHYALVASVTDD